MTGENVWWRERKPLEWPCPGSYYQRRIPEVECDNEAKELENPELDNIWSDDDEGEFGIKIMKISWL